MKVGYFSVICSERLCEEQHIVILKSKCGCYCQYGVQTLYVPCHYFNMVRLFVIVMWFFLVCTVQLIFLGCAEICIFVFVI